jgi:hypothetical protein
MPCVVLHPLLEEALDAEQEVITKVVVIISTRINAKRFIIVVFKVKKGNLDGDRLTVNWPVQGSRTTKALIGIGE